MKMFRRYLKHSAALALGLGMFSGCESTDGGGGGSTTIYYGVGFADPWYYGPGYYPPDVIVTPPGRPDRPDRPPHIEQPIARPMPTAAPRARTSIPSTPRPMARPAMRR